MGKELEGAKDRKAITDRSVTSKATEKKKRKNSSSMGSHFMQGLSGDFK